MRAIGAWHVATAHFDAAAHLSEFPWEGFLAVREQVVGAAVNL